MCFSVVSPCLRAPSLSHFYGVLLSRSAASEPARMAVLLLDLCDRLLKLTDSPALQAAIHQPIDLQQAWEHRHICVLSVCVCVCVRV